MVASEFCARTIPVTGTCVQGRYCVRVTIFSGIRVRDLNSVNSASPSTGSVDTDTVQFFPA